MSQKTATVIGSTGLIGGHLIELLQYDDDFDTIKALVRRPVSFKQSKVEMKLVNFDDHESVKLAIDGSDAVFCAVGTTQKKVKGDKEAYRKIDYNIPVNAARFCDETGCENFLLVSSVGANSESNNFYLKLKGEVENTIEELAIRSICIFRPSILTGKRAEFRLGEKIGQSLMNFFAFLMIGRWEKYRPVDAITVAKAMLQVSKEEPYGVSVYEFSSIRDKATKISITEHLHPAT